MATQETVVQSGDTKANGASKGMVRASPQQTMAKTLEQWKPTLAAVLPRHLNADRIIKMVMSAFMRSDDLQACSPISIVKAVVMAAELGLEPGGLLGEAYLVPFNNKKKVKDGNVWKETIVREAQLIPGYKGLIKLARQSGDVSSVSAFVVDENEEFEVELGLSPNIKHTYRLDGRAGKMKAVYCVVQFKDGSRHFEVMSAAEVMAIRNRSPAGKSGPWVTDEGEMAKKTVVKRTLKMVTLSPERPHAAIAAAADDAASLGEAFSTDTSSALDTLGEEVPSVTQSRTDALAEKFDPETGEVK